MLLREIRRGAGGGRFLAFDGGEELRSTASVVSALSLYDGMELTEGEYLELRRESAMALARQKAAELAGARDMSRGELIEKLLQRGFDEDSAGKAADWLEELGVIDDAQYAELVVRHYAAKGYGRGRVRDELYRRRVPREYWDEALETLPDQSDTLDKLLEAKLRGTAEDLKSVKKATDSLRRRGFTWDEISAALQRRAEEMPDAR